MNILPIFYTAVSQCLMCILCAWAKNSFYLFSIPLHQFFFFIPDCSAVFTSCPCCFQVGDPLSYERESWMMEKDEKLQTVPILHMQGNALVKQRKFREAASKYKEAVLLLKTVQSRVSEGWGRKRCGRKWEEMSDVQAWKLWGFSFSSGF